MASRFGNHGQDVNSEFDRCYAATVQVGSMLLHGNATPPTGFLECNGDSLLRAGIYENLFNVIGTTFGAVDLLHFTLPDLSLWVPANTIGIIKY